MYLIRWPSTPRTARQIRRFRLLFGVGALTGLTVLALQYTAYALLPTTQTSTIAGVVTGLLVGGLVVERRLAARRHPDRAG